MTIKFLQLKKKCLAFFLQNILLVSRQSTGYQISEREKEILHLMVEGGNFKNIADKAFISYETVRTYVKHIYKKLHVASRREAIQKSLQQGLN